MASRGCCCHYLNGDLIFDVQLKRMVAFHMRHGVEITLLGHPNDHTYDSGLIVHAPNGQVQNWMTKEDERS